MVERERGEGMTGRMTHVALLVPAVVLAIVIGGCAVGNPKPATQVSDTGATLNADIYSSFAGDTTYFWCYGETTACESETPHRTIPIADDQPHPVSEPIGGLTPGTTYHTQVCAQDDQEDPPRFVCSKDHTFETLLLDRAKGSASDGTLSVSIDASSGPSGEDPSGPVSGGGFIDGHFVFFEGTVGCLEVDGNTAIVGYTGEQTIDGLPAGSRMTFYARIVDSGSADQDRTPDEDTLDQLPGVHTESPDCDLYQPGGQQLTGNFTVTDAQ
jgi:hypothetical protein